MSVQTESMADVVRSVPSGASAYQFGGRRKPLVEILNELQRCADLPLQQAGTLSAEVYTNEDFYQWELENIFQPEWICLAHVSQIPKPGDFLNIDLLGEPLIVVRGKDHQVRVLSRVCPHRAMDIMPPGFGLMVTVRPNQSRASPGAVRPDCSSVRIMRGHLNSMEC
jgi:hypothetical protein